MNQKGFAICVFLLLFVSSSFIGVSNQTKQAYIDTNKSETPTDGGLQNTSWPMYCHDTHHTGHSPYSTINNPSERWSFKAGNCDYLYGSPVIGNSAIYFGGFDFFALNSNGSLKWKYNNQGRFESAPAIDENGIIYIGTINECPSHVYAFYPNGTVKWAYLSGEDIYSSPVIGGDGTIYYGGESNSINALWPNGTLRWRYQTGFIVYSSPAIGDDGTIYCGCHDGYLYALYPNNGTLKWKFHTGDWIRTSPCIGDDGTIYCVSLDCYLYAIYPNGTMKWRVNVGAGTSPTIGSDRTIYAGWNTFYAINPDGSVKWAVDAGGDIEGATPCTSGEGTIYYGTSNGYIVSMNPNGEEQWRKYIGECQSAPAIDETGTIYIGDGYGYLHAFGSLDINAPTAPIIKGQTDGRIKKTYSYTFTSASPLGNNIYYTVDWGDGTITDWLGPYASGELLTLNHSWGSKGTFLIQARAKDTGNLWGPWGILSVTMPLVYEPPHFRFFEWLFERFPNAFPIIRFLLDFDHCHSLSYRYSWVQIPSPALFSTFSRRKPAMGRNNDLNS